MGRPTREILHVAQNDKPPVIPSEVEGPPRRSECHAKPAVILTKEGSPRRSECHAKTPLRVQNGRPFADLSRGRGNWSVREAGWRHAERLEQSGEFTGRRKIVLRQDGGELAHITDHER
jgi:hypothetical protein